MHRVFLLLTLAVGALAALGGPVLDARPAYPAKAAGCYIGIAWLASRHARRHHPFRPFGPANMITAVRAGLVALIVGLIGEVGSSAIAMAAAGLATIASALDGLDGWAARRTGLASEFGARFDLETDGLLILALSVLVWRLGITGPWILLAGLLRYLFIAAGAVRPWMRRPLPPSRRRQTTCVAQIVGLVAALAPVVPRGPGRAVAASTLAALCYSFCVDTYWLWQRRGHLDAV